MYGGEWTSPSLPLPLAIYIFPFNGYDAQHEFSTDAGYEALSLAVQREALRF